VQLSKWRVEQALQKGKPWTEDVLRKADRTNNLEAVQRLTSLLGCSVWADYLSPDLHFKPLLEEVLLEQMKKSKRSVEIDGKGALVYTGVYALVAEDGYFKNVKHVDTGAVAPMPEDYSIKADDPSWKLIDNWS
jgi:hypothetical protein